MTLNLFCGHNRYMFDKQWIRYTQVVPYSLENKN
jgi:hypothetical protein